MTGIVYSGNAYKPGVAFDRMGQVLDIDSMSLQEAMLQIGLLIVKIQTEKVDGDIEKMEKNTKKIEKLNVLLGEMSELQAIVGSKQTGDMSAFLSKKEDLQMRVNKAIQACADPGKSGGENIDLSGFFSRSGKCPEEPFEFHPLPKDCQNMPKEAREFLEMFGYGRQYLSRYDNLSNHGWSDGTPGDIYALAAKIGAESSRWEVEDVRRDLRKLGWGDQPMKALNDHAVSRNEARADWWAAAPLVSNVIGPDTPVSEFLAAVKKLEGKIQLCQNDGQKIMVEFNKKNGLLNFSIDMVSNYNKALGELMKEIIGKTQSR